MGILISWLQAHGAVALVGLFACASSILSAVAALLSALGKALPPWMNSTLSFLASALHLLNGNAPAAIAAVQPKAPSA